MANFHLEIKHHSKRTKTGKYKSIESIIAYRARDKLGDFDYSKKNDLIEVYDLFPNEFEDSDIIKKMSSINGFCETINEVEKRKDSQVFDEIIISLQHELSIEENKTILNQLIDEFYVENEKRFAKIFIHNPQGKNLHAHVVLTQRPLETAPNSPVRLGKKIRYDFINGKPKNAENVILMRSRWASLCNDQFYKKGIRLEITHESLKTQHQKALKAKNYKQAIQLDRPSPYIPLNVLSSKFAVSENHSLSFDFETNKKLQDYFRNRRNLESCDLVKVFDEIKLREELNKKNLFRTGSLELIRKFQKVSYKKLIEENELKTRNPLYLSKPSSKSRTSTTYKQENKKTYRYDYKLTPNRKLNNRKFSL